MTIKILIDNGKKILTPEIQDNVTVEWERTGMAGRMTFTALADKKLDFSEGNAVTLRVNKKPFFLGYVFTRNQTEPDKVTVTCYDQLRYLKNQESYVFENKTATEMIRKIAKDFKLSCGKLADTKYKLETFTKDNTQLFDIINEALKETSVKKEKKYVLYDEFGKFRLQDENDMQLNLLVDEATAQTYSYSSSIDNETYNKIKVIKEGKDNGSRKSNDEEAEKQRILNRQIYVAQDKKNMGRWGTLQLVEEIDKESDGRDRAQKLLKKYNAPKKTLQISGALGDVRVRAGSQIGVILKSATDKKTRKLIKLRVENVRHIFSGDLHTMDLTLKGKGFDA